MDLVVHSSSLGLHLFANSVCFALRNPFTTKSIPFDVSRWVDLAFFEVRCGLRC